MGHSSIKDQFARLRERNHKLCEDHRLVLKHMQRLDKKVCKLEAALDFAQSRINRLAVKVREKKE